MARNTDKTDTPQVPHPDAVAAAEQVPVIDTPAIVEGADPTDADLENRPGVLPDSVQPDIDPITNLRREQLDESGLPLPNALQPPVLNARVAQPRPVAESKSKGELIEMVATADIWPREKPKDWPEDQEYRIRAGQTVKLPKSEAMDRMEAGTARRANPRA